MARIARNSSWLVGHTPLVELGSLCVDGNCRVLAKLEFFNPTGSNKDRAVVGMLDHAERAGFLTPGGTVVECSGGDLGVSLATFGRQRGYRIILTMPESMADSRCNLLSVMGAEVVLTDSRAGIRGAMQRAEELTAETPGAICLQPFTNRANANAHEQTTAREIWEDTDGLVDIVVCPVATGGTAAGCIEFFRRTRPEVKVVAVEPSGSPVLSGGKPGAHDIPGLGPGFVPDILNPVDLAEVLQIRDDEAISGVRRMAADEGILAGPASGAVLHAGLRLAERNENRGRTIVTILPDSGERYEEHEAYAGRSRH